MILGKKIGAAVLSFALVLSLLVLPAGAAGEIGVTIDGTSVLYDDGYGRPFLDSAGRTQVPFRPSPPRQCASHCSSRRHSQSSP